MKKIFLRISSYLNDLDLASLFFLFFVFTLSFQKKLSFYSSYSFLEGKYMDYLTYSFYGFEIFIILAFVFWVARSLLRRERFLLGDTRMLSSLCLLIASSILSTFFAFDRFTSYYYLLVLAELFVFYIFINNQIKSNKSIFVFLNVFIFMMFLQSIVGVLQFVFGHSVGLHLLGESPISAEISGVAKTVIGGVKHIRAYGTFSHPNVFAIFLLVSGIANLYLFSLSRDKTYRWYMVVVFLTTSLALFLTFSRLAWLLAIIFWGIYMLRTLKFKILLSGLVRSRKSVLLISSLILIVVLFFIYFAPAIWWRVNPSLSTTWESLGVRMVVFQKGWLLAKSHLFGIGIGNFIIEIAYQLTGYPSWMVEPAHNTFFMVLVETGVMGLLSIGLMFFYVFASFKKSPLFLKLIILVLFVSMFFDHAFWDIRQAQFLLFLFLGIFSVYISYGKKLEG